MGDLHFTRQDCDEVVAQCLETADVHTTDFEIIPRHKNNYIFKITIDRPSEQTLYLYAKSGSKGPRNSKILDDFKRDLRDFDAKMTPKFFCGKSGMLFFEDLTCQRFQTKPRLFDLKHVQRGLAVLAQFHAAGLAYGSKKLEEYHLEEGNFELSEVGDAIWAVVDNKESVDEIRTKLEEKQRSKFARTVCHGGLTWANILYHYENGTPDDCRLLNFGGRLYAPPAYDVLQLIFFNTDEKFRKCNLEGALRYYHEHLEEEMRKYRLRIDDILSFEEFQLSCDAVLPLIKLEKITVKKTTIDEDELKRATLELKEVLSFSRITREDCYVVAKKVIESSDYELLSFELTPLEDMGLSSNHQLKIKIRHSLDDKTIGCFVKSKTNDSFKKELFLFDIFVPKLHQLRISLVNDCIPSCYSQKPEDLLLEDLQDYSHPATVDFSLLSVAVKKLAKFHACSLLMEEEMSKQLKTTYRLTRDYDNFLTDTFGTNIHLVKDSVALLGKRINLDNLQEVLANPSERFRNVLSVGALSTRKIVAQFDDNVAVDCRFVDFQTAMYCPPALDLLCLIYLTENKEKEEELIKIYHDELGKIVSSYNYNVDKFLSYDEFIESVRCYRSQAIMQALICNMTEENSSLVDDGGYRKESLVQLCQNPVFRKKLQQNVADLCDVFSSSSK